MKEDKQVLLIFASNYKEKLDDAILRPGRINDKIKMDEPDFETRERIFKIKLRTLRDMEMLDQELSYDKFAERTEGLTGAHIHQIVEDRVDRILFEDEEKELIDDEVVLEAIRSVKDEKGEKKDRRYIQ